MRRLIGNIELIVLVQTLHATKFSHDQRQRQPSAHEETRGWPREAQPRVALRQGSTSSLGDAGSFVARLIVHQTFQILDLVAELVNLLLQLSGIPTALQMLEKPLWGDLAILGEADAGFIF